MNLTSEQRKALHEILLAMETKARAEAPKRRMEQYALMTGWLGAVDSGTPRRLLKEVPRNPNDETVQKAYDWAARNSLNAAEVLRSLWNARVDYGDDDRVPGVIADTGEIADSEDLDVICEGLRMVKAHCSGKWSASNAKIKASLRYRNSNWMVLKQARRCLSKKNGIHNSEEVRSLFAAAIEEQMEFDSYLGLSGADTAQWNTWWNLAKEIEASRKPSYERSISLGSLLHCSAGCGPRAPWHVEALSRGLALATAETHREAYRMFMEAGRQASQTDGPRSERARQAYQLAGKELLIVARTGLKAAELRSCFQQAHDAYKKHLDEFGVSLSRDDARYSVIVEVRSEMQRCSQDSGTTRRRGYERQLARLDLLEQQCRGDGLLDDHHVLVGCYGMRSQIHDEIGSHRVEAKKYAEYVLDQLPRFAFGASRAFDLDRFCSKWGCKFTPYVYRVAP